MKTIKLIAFCVLISLKVNAQNSSLQIYDKEIIKENFSDDQTQFQLQNNDDNYFIIEGGDLFLSRKNKKTDSSIFTQKLIKSQNYKIKTAIKISPSTENKSYVGILLNTQLDGKGSLSIEINKKQEYRVRQIKDGTSKYISGASENKGWVKNQELKNADEFNYIDVISNRGKIDVYFNFKYVETFDIPEYTSGGLGFLTGPNSQSRVDFLYVHEKSDNMSENQIKLANRKTKELESTIKNSLQKEQNEQENAIKATHLQNQLNVLTQKYNVLNQQHSSLKQQQKTITNLENEESKNEIKKLKASISDLKKKNSSAGKELISKSKNLKILKEENSKLSSNLNSMQQKTNAYQKNMNILSMENKNLSDSIQNIIEQHNKLLLKNTELKSEQTINDNNASQLILLQKKIVELENKNEILTIQKNTQKNIALEFAASYRTEKEKSEQFRNEIKIAQNNISTEKTDSITTEYRVQLGTFDKEINTVDLDIDKLTVIITKDNKYIYLSGKFTDYDVAKSHLLEIYQKGFKDSYIVKF